ncbi:regulator of g protein signaling-like protein [Dermatophagoides farinae]|uniref:Regulator of g protein signaling-like protein n=1 Tax=Dermatophagoides farinae TaxID=6954 RepID=A0A9D4NPA5_DERFA|nr:uncharacterized protein LOC124495324 isoform X2 [Dermatophagoides farinae]KAH7636896.1 regulator of g protein signaling-like protein [Dermatophagoides farinae]
MIFRFPFTNHAHNSNNDNTSSSMNLSRRMREQKSSSLKLFNRNKDLMIDHHRQQQQCRAYDEIKSRTRNSMMLDQDNSIGCLHNHLGAFNQTKSSWTMDNRNFHFQITMDNRYNFEQQQQQQLRKQKQTKKLSNKHDQDNDGNHIKEIIEEHSGKENQDPSCQQQQQQQQQPQQLMTKSNKNDDENKSNNENINKSQNVQWPSKIYQQLQHQQSVAVDEYCCMDGSSPPPSTSFLLHHHRHHHHHHLDQEHEEKHDERPIDVGWVGGWASDFDILLSDSIGIKAFTDFLRKEFSYENLQFFLAIQEFKNLTDPDEIRKKSHEIYNKFIALSAPEPVNVDSRARKSVESGLNNPNNRIFLLAEEQIYNLMKFDSYVRFLKSDIYEKCSLLDLKGESLPYENDDAIIDDTSCDTLLNLASSSANTVMTSGRSGYHSGKNNPTAVKKRRSFIPWARLKSSINHKAASLSSMAAPSSTKTDMFGSKKQYMMRKLTNSIHKIRSKSLDEHLTNHVNNKTQQSIGSEPHSNNSSIDKSSIISNGQKNQFNSASRSSLMPNSSDSIDSSDHNVFPPSPDNLKSVEIVDASCSPPTSIPSTIEHLKRHSESDPVSPAKFVPSAVATSLTSTSTTETAANISIFPSSSSSSSFNHNCNRDNCHFLRIVFPDRSQTVVPSSPNETINNLLKKLFEKRSLKYLAWDVFITGNEKPLDLSTNTTQLGCVELRVEQRVIFRIEFPSQDIIGVKTRPTKLCSEVFHPLLMRYGYRPEHTVMTIAETEQIVPQMSPVSVIDGQHIVVSYFDDLEEWGWDTTRNNIPVALSLAGKSFSEDSSIKSKKKDEKSMGGHALIDQHQQASSVPSVATYHNLGSIRDHLLASRYIAAKNNQSNNSNLECSPQPDSYDSPTNTSSSTPGDDTQSDIFFRELMKTAHTVPSPPRGPSSTSTYSAAYGIINSSSPPNETINRSQPPQTPISNTNRTSYRSSNITNNSSQQQQHHQRNQPLRDLQNHRHFKSYQPSPLSYEPVTVPRSQEMARKQMMPETEMSQSVSSNSSPSINTLPMSHTNYQHSLINQPVSMQESDKLILLQPEKPPLRRQKSDPPCRPPPLPPKSNNTTNMMINTNNKDTNTICPPRPPPRTSICSHQNKSLTSDNCQKQSSSSTTSTNPSDSNLA